MNLDDYKQAYPYICNSCGEFSYNFAEYCEYCGTEGSLREAKIIDYEKRIDKKMPQRIDMKMSKRSDKKTSIISEEEAKKILTYSIIMIVITLFLSLIGLNYAFVGSTGRYIIFFSTTYMAVGIVSLIFYFINPEISYGMLMSRKKIKNNNTRDVLKGRKVLKVILITGLCFSIIVFVLYYIYFWNL